MRSDAALLLRSLRAEPAVILQIDSHRTVTWAEPRSPSASLPAATEAAAPERMLMGLAFISKTGACEVIKVYTNG